MSFGHLGALGRGFGKLGGPLGGASNPGPPGSPFTLAASVGSFALTGIDMTPLNDHLLAASVATFTLTGIDAFLDTTARVLPADPASFTLTGIAANLVYTPVSGSVIKTIQQGSIALAAAAGSGTFSIPTPVTAANAMLVWGGATDDIAGTVNYGRAAVRITLTNGSTVTANRDQSTTNAVTVYFTIVEFASGVNSIQYGSILISAAATSNTATLGTTVGSNAFVIWLGSSTSIGSLNYGDIRTGVTLTNSTTVTANAGTSSANGITTSFVAVDLDTTIVSSVQQKILTSAVGATSDTDTLTSVTTANTLLFFGGDTLAGAGGTALNSYSQVLSSGTGVTFTRLGTGTTSRTHYYTAVVFASGALSVNGVQRNTIALSTATSATATITSVNTSKAFANWGNYRAANANGNTINPNLVLTNGTTVTATVPSAGTVTVSFEVIEFA